MPWCKMLAYITGTVDESAALVRSGSRLGFREAHGSHAEILGVASAARTTNCVTAEFTDRPVSESLTHPAGLDEECAVVRCSVRQAALVSPIGRTGFVECAHFDACSTT